MELQGSQLCLLSWPFMKQSAATPRRMRRSLILAATARMLVGESAAQIIARRFESLPGSAQVGTPRLVVSKAVYQPSCFQEKGHG
jgi:hypothetical protein